MAGWIAVDFDATLVKYDGWNGPLDFGEPIMPMIERVKAWLAQGLEVRIFTARVAIPEVTPEYLRSVAEQARAHGQPETFDPVEHVRMWTAAVTEIRAAIEAWCLEHIGQALAITNVKDFGMIELWDDRAVRVRANEGIPCCAHHSS